MVKMKIFSVPFLLPYSLDLLQPIWCSPPLGKGAPQVALARKEPCLLPSSASSFPLLSPYPSPPPSFFSSFSSLLYLVHWYFHQCYVYCDSQSMVLQRFDRECCLSRVRIWRLDKGLVFVPRADMCSWSPASDAIIICHPDANSRRWRAMCGHAPPPSSVSVWRGWRCMVLPCVLRDDGSRLQEFQAMTAVSSCMRHESHRDSQLFPKAVAYDDKSAGATLWF